jgi:hypothetical protein
MRRVPASDALKKTFSAGNSCVPARLRVGWDAMNVCISPFRFFPFRYWPTVAATAV